MKEDKELPSGYWEPQPDDEDLERIEQEYRDGIREYWMVDEPIPFE